MKQRERRGLLLAFLVFGVYWGAWSASIPALRRQAAVSDGELGLALAAIALAAVPSMAVAGRVIDRYGPRWSIPVATVLFGLVVPLPSLAHGLGALVAGLLAVGAMTGFLDLLINAETAAWERTEDDKLMSYAHAAFSFGVLAGSVVAGVARDGGASPFRIQLVVGAVIVVVGLTQPAYRKAEGEASGKRGRLPLLLLAVGLLTAIGYLCEDAIQTWSSLQLERGLDATPAVSGLGPGLFAGSMAVGRLAGGPLSKRFREAPLLSGAGLVLAVGAFVLALAGTPAVALVGLVIAGAGTSIIAPVLISYVGAHAAPGRQGADLAAVAGVGYAGFVAGPPIVGVVSAATSLPFALGCLGGLGILLAITGPLLLSGKMSS